MKILFVCTVPTETNGISNMIFNLLAAFDGKSNHIGYVSINDPSSRHKEKLIQMNVKLHILQRKLSNPLAYVSALSKIAKGYDVIHVHGNSATMVLEMMAAKIADIPVRIAHSHSISCLHRKLDKLARPFFHKLCNGRLACSNNAGKWLFPNMDFKIINNGIDTAKFIFNRNVRASIRQQFGLKDEIVIGNIANFIPEKNHTFLLKIFTELVNRHQNIRLLLLGDGLLKKSFEESARLNGIIDRIIMPGCVDNPYDYINALDIVIMPSLFEGLPLSLLEAQANGLPAIISSSITTDVNITGNIHFISLKKTPEEWADMVINILNTTPVRNEETSKKCIEQILFNGFDISKSAQIVHEFYAQQLTMNRK